MDEVLFAKAVQYISELFQQNSGGHDAAHSLRVYRNAMMIADKESACDREIAALAALLHDADDHKLFSTINNANARAFLEENKVSAEMTDRICEVINSVSFSQNKDRRPETIEAKVVQDADRLDAGQVLSEGQWGHGLQRMDPTERRLVLLYRGRFHGRWLG